MELLNFIKSYWVQICFVCALLFGLYKFARAMIESTKCSLRNDVLAIYDKCKDKKQITKFELQAIENSFDLYKSLKGNSFVATIYQEVKKYKIID